MEMVKCGRCLQVQIPARVIWGRFPPGESPKYCTHDSIGVGWHREAIFCPRKVSAKTSPSLCSEGRLVLGRNEKFLFSRSRRSRKGCFTASVLT